MRARFGNGPNFNPLRPRRLCGESLFNTIPARSRRGRTNHAEKIRNQAIRAFSRFKYLPQHEKNPLKQIDLRSGRLRTFTTSFAGPKSQITAGKVYQSISNRVRPDPGRKIYDGI